MCAVYVWVCIKCACAFPTWAHEWSDVIIIHQLSMLENLLTSCHMLSSCEHYICHSLFWHQGGVRLETDIGIMSVAIYNIALEYAYYQYGFIIWLSSIWLYLWMCRMYKLILSNNWCVVWEKHKVYKNHNLSFMIICEAQYFSLKVKHLFGLFKKDIVSFIYTILHLHL